MTRDAWRVSALQILTLMFVVAVVVAIAAFGVRDAIAYANGPIRNDINQPRGVIVGDPDDLVRYVDTDAGVVCYHRNNYPEGLACLPIGETRLGP